MHVFIPRKWSVLVVEDNDERIRWFRQQIPQAVFATTAREAITQLGLKTFNVIFLDHDLHWIHAADINRKGSGQDVARFLSCLGYQGLVLIHSKNEQGVARMKDFLLYAKVAPFGTFEVDCVL